MSEHPAGPPDQQSTTELFEEAYLQWAPAVLGFALRRCGSREEAGDIVADAFTIAWRHRDAMPGDLLSIKLWIFGITRKCLMNSYRADERSGRLFQRIASHFDSAPALDASVIHTQRENYSLIHSCLAQLSDSDREIVTLVAWENLSPAQAAEILGIPPGTARVRLHRARQKLRNLLDSTETDKGF